MKNQKLYRKESWRFMSVIQHSGDGGKRVTMHLMAAWADNEFQDTG